MAWMKIVFQAFLVFIGWAQQQPAVQEAEKKIIDRSIGLIDRLFDWIEDGEEDMVVLKTARQMIQEIVDEYGEDDLIDYLASRGIIVASAPPSVATGPDNPAPQAP